MAKTAKRQAVKPGGDSLKDKIIAKLAAKSADKLETWPKTEAQCPMSALE